MAGSVWGNRERGKVAIPWRLALRRSAFGRVAHTPCSMARFTTVWVAPALVQGFHARLVLRGVDPWSVVEKCRALHAGAAMSLKIVLLSILHVLSA
jgi:hypothetical protein